ncbi:hypothetical protein ACTXT7_009003 [Hymenolepis weldensis]
MIVRKRLFSSPPLSPPPINRHVLTPPSSLYGYPLSKLRMINFYNLVLQPPPLYLHTLVPSSSWPSSSFYLSLYFGSFKHYRS